MSFDVTGTAMRFGVNCATHCFREPHPTAEEPQERAPDSLLFDSAATPEFFIVLRLHIC